MVLSLVVERPQSRTCRHAYGHSVLFLFREKVEGSSFLFEMQISEPAIANFTQEPDGFWDVTIMFSFIDAYEASHAEAGWVNSVDCTVDQPWLLKEDYMCGDLKLDPFGYAWGSCRV